MQLEPSALTCRAVVPDPQAPLTWIHPADRRSRDRAPHWCATVGPVFFEPWPTIATPHTAVLTIISWNVHVGAGRVGDLIDRLKRGEFTDGQPVADFVLLLQEVVRRDDSVPAAIDARLPVTHRIIHSQSIDDEDVRAIARRHGLALLYVPAMRNGGPAVREDRGNAIASTLPLDDVRILELPFEHQRRVVPIATVGGDAAGSRWRLRIAAVHFDTAVALTHGGPFAARRREAEALISALPPADIPTLAAGDFNTWLGVGEPAVESLRRAFPDTPAGRTAATWHGPFGMRATLDHVFLRGIHAATVRRLNGRFGSDHYPILARLRFR